MTASAVCGVPSAEAGQIEAGIEIWSREAHQLYQKSLVMSGERSKAVASTGSEASRQLPGAASRSDRRRASVRQCTTPYSPNSRVVSGRARRCSNRDERPKVRVESPWLADS